MRNIFQDCFLQFFICFEFIFKVTNGMRDDRESYQNRMARKEALSRWLAEAAKTRISKEVDEANFQVRTPTHWNTNDVYF